MFRLGDTTGVAGSRNGGVMYEYTIYPIKVGEFTAMEKSSMTYRVDCGVKLAGIPILIYLIRGHGRTVLVDTGPSDEEWSRKHHHDILYPPEEHPVARLEKLGVNAKEIETVVLSHLHWDHCFNTECFPKARFYVQKREVAYAVDPMQEHWQTYESWQLGMTPPWFKSYHQFHIVDGDYSLLPGIDLVTLPGHSPGLQGVVVQTAKGRHLIASDCVNFYENWEGNGLFRHISPGVYCNLADCHASYARIEKICDVVLPGHESKVLEHAKYPV